MKRCLTLLVIGKTHPKTTMRYHFMSASMVIMKKQTNKNKQKNNKRQQGCGEIRTLYFAGGTVKQCSHCGRVCQFLKELDIELPYDLCNSTPRCIPKRTEGR